MLSDPEKLAAMGRSAHSRAAEWLAPTKIAEQATGIYRRVLALAAR
jgi:hypothetical protein